jgi:peptide deformylase
MPTIAILQYPDKRLNKKAEIVTDFKDKALQLIIDDMLETLHASDNCAGLAATQLNIKKPQQVTVIYDYRKEKSPSKDSALCLINPEIIAQSEEESHDPESCMSISGGVYEVVTRAAKVTVRACDRDGNPLEIEGEGFMAKLLQHEIDHLNGIIFIDRLSRLKRQRIDKKMFKLKKLAKST